jgi:hypothetical protein
MAYNGDINRDLAALGQHIGVEPMIRAGDVVVQVPFGVLVSAQVALIDIMRELSYVTCDIDACGCATSRKLAFAREVADKLAEVIGEAHGKSI